MNNALVEPSTLFIAVNFDCVFLQNLFFHLEKANTNSECVIIRRQSLSFLSIVLHEDLASPQKMRIKSYFYTLGMCQLFSWCWQRQEFGDSNLLSFNTEESHTMSFWQGLLYFTHIQVSSCDKLTMTLRGQRSWTRSCTGPLAGEAFNRVQIQTVVISVNRMTKSHKVFFHTVCTFYCVDLKYSPEVFVRFASLECAITLWCRILC